MASGRNWAASRIAWMGTPSPRDELSWVIYAATAIAFLSAPPDIAIDAYPPELPSKPQSVPGNAVQWQPDTVAGPVPGP